MSKTKKPEDKDTDRLIAVNRRARHDYFIEGTYEAGIALQGWEVKSLRDGRAQITEAYITLKNNEAWMIGAHFTALRTASTHIHPDFTRSRKLLLHAREISQLVGKVERAGYTLVPLDMHWNKGRAKLTVGLAKGKKEHDKRDTIKQREWQREQGRTMRHAR